MADPAFVLNVNGVLTSDRTYATARYYTEQHLLDPIALRLMEQLCRATGGKVVIFSAWAVKHRMPLDWIELFAPFGVTLPVVGAISTLIRTPGGAPAAVKQVLAEQGITRAVLLDDDEPPPHWDIPWIAVDRRVGLSERDCLAALNRVAPDCDWAKYLRASGTAFAVPR